MQEIKGKEKAGTDHKTQQLRRLDEQVKPKHTLSTICRSRNKDGRGF